MPMTKPQRPLIEKGVFRQPRQDYLEESVSQVTLERDSLCKVSDFDVTKCPKSNLPELCNVDGQGRAVYWLYKHNLADSASIRQRLRQNYEDKGKRVVYDTGPCCSIFSNVQTASERARTMLRRLRLKREMCRLKDLFLHSPKSDIEIVETYNSYMNLHDIEAVQLYLKSNENLSEDKYDNLMLNLKLKNSLIHTAQKNAKMDLEKIFDASSATTTKASEHQRVQIEKMLKSYTAQSAKPNAVAKTRKETQVKQMPTAEFKSLPGMSFNDLDHILNQLRHFVRGDKHSKITEAQKEQLEQYLKSIADESTLLERNKSCREKQINEGVSNALDVQRKSSSLETQFGSNVAPSEMTSNVLKECEQNMNLGNVTYERVTATEEYDKEIKDMECKEVDSKNEETCTDADDIQGVFDGGNLTQTVSLHVPKFECEKFIESLEIKVNERIRQGESDKIEENYSLNELAKIEDHRLTKREKKRDNDRNEGEEHRKSKPRKIKPKHCEIEVIEKDDNQVDLNESTAKTKKVDYYSREDATDDERDDSQTYSRIKQIYKKIPYICFADEMQISSDSCYEQNEADIKVARLSRLKYKRRKIKAISDANVKDDERGQISPGKIEAKTPTPQLKVRWVSQSEKCMENQHHKYLDGKKKQERKYRRDEENEQINRKPVKSHVQDIKGRPKENYVSEEMINKIDYHEYYESEFYGRCEKGEEQPFYMLKVDGKSHNNYEYEIRNEVNQLKQKDEQAGKRKSRRREKRVDYLDHDSCKAFGTAIDFDLYRYESDDQSERNKPKMCRDDCKKALDEKCKLYTSDEIDTGEYDIDYKSNKRSNFKDSYDHSYGFEDYSLQEKDEDTLENKEHDYTKALGLRNIVYEEDDADSDHTLNINNSLIHLDDNSMFKTPANVSLEDFLAHEVECKSQEEKIDEYDERLKNVMTYNGHITNIAIFNKGCKIGKISTNSCCADGKLKTLNKSTQMFEHVTKNDLYTLQWIHDNLFEININPHTLIVDEKIKEISEVSHIS